MKKELRQGATRDYPWELKFGIGSINDNYIELHPIHDYEDMVISMAEVGYDTIVLVTETSDSTASVLESWDSLIFTPSEFEAYYKQARLESTSGKPKSPRLKYHPRKPIDTDEDYYYWKDYPKRLYPEHFGSFRTINAHSRADKGSLQEIEAINRYSDIQVKARKREALYLDSDWSTYETRHSQTGQSWKVVKKSRQWM